MQRSDAGAKGNDVDDGYKTTTKDNDNYDKGRRRRQDNNEDNGKWTRRKDFEGKRTRRSRLERRRI